MSVNPSHHAPDDFDGLDPQEAEKYYQRFHNKIFVIKYGGSALESSELMRHFLKSVAKLHHKGIFIVLVHGGGPMLSRKMKEYNIPVEFKNGLRVSSRETVLLAEKVFSEINQKICTHLNEISCKTQPFTHGSCISAELIDPKNEDNRVGRITNIQSSSFDLQKIPVVSSLGTLTDSLGNVSAGNVSAQDRLLNLNADHLAVSLSHYIRARKLIYISDVNGIYANSNNPASKIDHITESEIERLMGQGVLHGGMQLKVRAALEALKGGVNKVHFIDGTIRNSLLYEVLTDKGMGTEIVHDQ